VQYAAGNLDDRQYVNSGGKEGALTKDQRDEAGTTAFYAEDRFSVTPRLSTVAGLRWATSLRRVRDHFLSNGDQSATRNFDAFTPRLGLLYDMPSLNGQLYANISRTYEPPLLLELNSLAVPGFVDVKPQDARQLEVGTRGSGRGWTWDVALYSIAIRDEIMNLNVQPFSGATFTVPTYRNADRTRHRGIEAGFEHDVTTNLLAHDRGGDRLSAHVAYTLNDFRFVRDSVYAGNRLPGAPDNVLNAELVYRHPAGITIRPSMEWVSGNYFTNSANTVSNDGWITFSARAELLMPHYNTRLFIEGRNLTDRIYSGAVTVDDAAGRYFLPADRRTLYAGIQWQH
jgi:iron complex outermembrane receptor protein